MSDKYKNKKIAINPEDGLNRAKINVLSRISDLEKQLVNEGHLDGYVVVGMKEELKWLKEQLEKLDASKES